MNKFDDIKSTITEKISNSDYFVTAETNRNFSGIYLLYVDYFESDKIIPIYVGQSVNIQKRYKEHIFKLLALNHFNYNYYHDNFFDGSNSLYEGGFSICKIFKFMVDNELTLDQLRMIVLEECKPESLDRLEQGYINKYKSVFFGFNQLNSFNFAIKKSRQYPISQTTLDEYVDLVVEDMRNMEAFQDYGYSSFNMNHAFHLHFKSDLRRSEKYSDFVREFSRFEKKYFLIHQDQDYIKQLSICKEYDEKRSDIRRRREKEYSALLDLYESLNDKAKKQLNYDDIIHFAEEVRQNRNSKELGLRVSKKWYKNGEHHFIVLDRLQDELNKLEASYDNNPYTILSRIEWNYRMERYKDIFPERYNSNFPLSRNKRQRHSSTQVNLVNEIPDNTLFVEFIFSSNTRKFASYTEPFLFLINTSHKDNGRIISENHYVESVHSIALQNTESYDFYEFEDVRPFLDWGLFPNMFGSRNIFNPIAYDPSIEEAYSSVSLNTEFNTGYSNFDILTNDLVDLEKVFSMLNEKWLGGMSVIIHSSEGPKTYSKSLNECLSKLNFEIVNVILSKKPVRGLVNIKPKKVREEDKNKKVNQINNDKVSRSDQHAIRLNERFGSNVKLINYQGNGKETTYQCSGCGYVWSRRSDRIFARPNCPYCKMVFKKN